MGNTFVVNIDNKKITASKDIRGWNLLPGDSYIAKRNTGWKLLVCKRVNPQNWVECDVDICGWQYSFDCCECYKVIDIEND